MVELCSLIARAEATLSLQTLADCVGMSPYHLHRVFKAATGLTPRGYAAAHRAERMRTELAHSDSVTQAIYAAGYQSSGRFYANAVQELGMVPGKYRAGGAGVEIRYGTANCTLGVILVAASERGICAILLGDDPAALAGSLRERFPKADLIAGGAPFDGVVARVVSFVETPWGVLDLPLDIQGTLFQQRVWQALRTIPVGETATYTQIAERICAPGAARAVAAACAANILAVAIPCHRVVRADGGIAGYRWGVQRKQAILALEKLTPTK